MIDITPEGSQFEDFLRRKLRLLPPTRVAPIATTAPSTSKWLQGLAFSSTLDRGYELIRSEMNLQSVGHTRSGVVAGSVQEGMAVESVPAYSQYQCGHLGFAYNEAAFRHFLDLDCRRAERTMRSLLLILVGARIRDGVRPALDRGNAERVFHALGACVREVDFTGWYREGAVAGAVVAMHAEAGADVTQRLAGRVDRILEAELGRERVARLRVRLVRLGRKAGY